MHTIAAKAVCLKEAMQPDFREYQKQVVANTRALAEGLAKRGFRIVSGGTDNHLFLVDVHSRGITGKDAQAALDRAAITLNKNAIPFDPTPPMTAGGIRLGAPSVTTRGMREPEMERIAGWIAEVLGHLGDSRRRAARAGRGGRTGRPIPCLYKATAALSAPTPMRVAIDIRRAGDYGFGTYIRNIVNQLGRLDHSTHYLLIGQRQHLEQFESLPDNFELLDHPYDFRSWRTHVQLPWLLRERSVDILHVPWLFAPILVPMRLVLTVHDLSDVMERQAGTPPLAQAGARFFARLAARRANHIFAVSYATKREVARTFHISESRISVVYNAVEERFLSDPLPADADRILERHAVTGPYVLYAGAIKPQKNLPRLIEAFAVAKAELAAENSEFAQLKLLVIGEAPARHAELRSAVVRARVREDVRFLGIFAAANIAGILRAGAGVPVPFPVRRIRTAAAGGHGARHAGAHLERIVAAGSISGRGAAGESGERFRYRARHPADPHRPGAARDADAQRLRSGAQPILAAGRGASPRSLRARIQGGHRRMSGGARLKETAA